MSTPSNDVIDLLLHCAEEPPTSVDAAHLLEGSIASGVETVPELEDVATALASYEPTEKLSPGLVGYDGLRLAARETLHDLGRHDRCLHDVPLITSRPCRAFTTESALVVGARVARAD